MAVAIPKSVTDAGPALEVLAVGDWLEMVRVDARRVATQMIQHQAFGDRSPVSLIGVAMSHPMSGRAGRPVGLEFRVQPVSVPVSRCGPIPATSTWVDGELRGETLIQHAPQSTGWKAFG